MRKNGPHPWYDEVIRISLAGLELMMMSAGPYFRFNPSALFLVACGTAAGVDRVTQAFLAMKKFDTAELERAYKGL